MDKKIIERSKKAEEMHDVDFARYIKDKGLDFFILQNMDTYAGSFVKALSVCIRTADPVNFCKLVYTFREYFNMYLPHHWEKNHGKN